MQRVAELAEEYADGHIRATTLQNLVILNVPEAKVAQLRIEIDTVRLKQQVGDLTGDEFFRAAQEAGKRRRARRQGE